MRVAPSLAFYGSDPMHLLRVPLLYIQYCTCLLHPFNELSGSVDYMKKLNFVNFVNRLAIFCIHMFLFKYRVYEIKEYHGWT